MLGKLIRKRKRKDVMKYDIRLYDSNSYTLFFELKIPKGWMEKAAELQAKLRGYIDQVVREVRKDLPGFSVHSARVEDALFERADDGGWRVRIRVTGVYSA